MIQGNMITVGGGTMTSAELGPKTISANGTFRASDDSLDGYSTVIVDVDAGPDNANFMIEGLSGSYYNSTVSYIRTYAFYYHPNITAVEFPACTSIGSSAFGNCSSLEIASFPVASNIGSAAFMNCTNLETASMPMCTKIEKWTFERCNKLKEGVFLLCDSIEVCAFGYCSSLSVISFPVCSTIGGSAFSNCKSLTEVTFPVCTDIMSYAFFGCESLTTVSFPVCSNIGVSAFRYCYALNSVYLLGSNVVSLTSFTTFMNSPISDSGYTGTYGSVFVPASLYDSYISANIWSLYSERIVAV